MINKGITLAKTDDYQNIKETVINYLYSNYSKTFYYDNLIKTIYPFLDSILDPIFKSGDFDFNTEYICSELERLLNTSVVAIFFSNDKFLYTLKELKNLLIALTTDDKKTSTISQLFTNIYEKFLFYTSNQLYTKVGDPNQTFRRTIHKFIYLHI